MNRDDILKLIRSELKPIEQKCTDLEKKFEGILNEIQFMSDKYDLLLEKVQTSCKKISELAEVSNALKKDLKNTKDEVQNCISETDELAQYLRRDCLEISGMNTKDEAQCIEAVKSIAEALDVEVSQSEISTAHPLPRYKRDLPPKFIVKFTRRDVKNNIYSKRSKLDKKTAKDLPHLRSDLRSDEKVYISESLTMRRKKLFGEANKLRKELHWKYIWTTNGKIYLRQDEKSLSHSFTTMEDFNSFKDRQTSAPQAHHPNHSRGRGGGRGRGR